MKHLETWLSLEEKTKNSVNDHISPWFSFFVHSRPDLSQVFWPFLGYYVSYFCLRSVLFCIWPLRVSNKPFQLCLISGMRLALLFLCFSPIAAGCPLDCTCSGLDVHCEGKGEFCCIETCRTRNLRSLNYPKTYSYCNNELVSFK